MGFVAFIQKFNFIKMLIETKVSFMTIRVKYIETISFSNLFSAGVHCYILSHKQSALYSMSDD